jgi:hypothetical protein
MKENCYEELTFAPQYKRIKALTYNQYGHAGG